MAEDKHKKTSEIIPHFSKDVAQRFWQGTVREAGWSPRLFYLVPAGILGQLGAGVLDGINVLSGGFLNVAIDTLENRIQNGHAKWPTRFGGGALALLGSVAYSAVFLAFIPVGFVAGLVGLSNTKAFQRFTHFLRPNNLTRKLFSLRMKRREPSNNFEMGNLNPADETRSEASDEVLSVDMDTYTLVDDLLAFPAGESVLFESPEDFKVNGTYPVRVNFGEQYEAEALPLFETHYYLNITKVLGHKTYEARICEVDSDDAEALQGLALGFQESPVTLLPQPKW